MFVMQHNTRIGGRTNIGLELSCSGVAKEGIRLLTFLGNSRRIKQYLFVNNSSFVLILCQHKGNTRYNSFNLWSCGVVGNITSYPNTHLLDRFDVAR